MCKFKYIPREFYYHEYDELQYLNKVCCPIISNRENYPDGEYLIRGNKKSHRKKYYCVNNQWYLVEDVKKDNGHYNCDSYVYMLFPMSKHSEYLELRKHYDKLTPFWKRSVNGYFGWLEITKLRRNTKLSFIKNS